MKKIIFVCTVLLGAISLISLTSFFGKKDILVETIYPKFSDKVMEKNFVPIRNYTGSEPYVDIIGEVLFQIEDNIVYCYPYIKTATGEVASMKYTIYEPKSNEKIVSLTGDYVNDGKVIYFFNKDSPGNTNGVGDRIYKGTRFSVTYNHIQDLVGTFTIEYKTTGIVGFNHEFFDNQYKHYIGINIVKY